jgi:hypothetical protein
LLTVVLAWVAFRVQRDARTLSASRFTNVSRELHETSASLASGGFGGASVSNAIEKALSVLHQYEIPDAAPPDWDQKLSADSRSQLHRQLGELHYLIAANHLQNLRGQVNDDKRQRELQLAKQHHQVARDLFPADLSPKVLSWQSELLCEPTDSSRQPEWQRFAAWSAKTPRDSSKTANWLDQRLLAIEYYRQGDFRTAAALLESGLPNHAGDYPS